MCKGHCYEIKKSSSFSSYLHIAARPDAAVPAGRAPEGAAVEDTRPAAGSLQQHTALTRDPTGGPRHTH